MMFCGMCAWIGLFICCVVGVVVVGIVVVVVVVVGATYECM